jgi:hypothetical protein
MSGPDSVVITSQSKNIPGRHIWEPYAGHEYTVFVDESFFKFFDFTHVEGNFVHGTVGVPTERYDSFTLALRPTVDEYTKAVLEATGAEPRELKSADLYKLSFSLRRRLLLRLNAALAANGGFVTGFYTSNRGYVMEKIREDLIFQEGIEAVPDDHGELFAMTAKSLNEMASGPVCRTSSQSCCSFLSLPRPTSSVVSVAHFAWSTIRERPKRTGPLRTRLRA